MNNVLTIDYSVPPSLFIFAVDRHPSRTDVVQLDPRNLSRVQVLDEGEVRSGFDYEDRIRKVVGSPNHLPDVRVLEELMKPENQHLIPDDWKEGVTTFWGTRLCDTDGEIYIPALSWHKELGKWTTSRYHIRGDWHSSMLAAAPSGS